MPALLSRLLLACLLVFNGLVPAWAVAGEPAAVSTVHAVHEAAGADEPGVSCHQPEVPVSSTLSEPLHQDCCKGSCDCACPSLLPSLALMPSPPIRPFSLRVADAPRYRSPGPELPLRPPRLPA